MFFNALFALCTVAVTTLASPINTTPVELTARGYSPSISFSHWGGFSSFDHFDDFYGANDFSHFNVNQVFVKDQELVCHTQQVVVIQQRLAVIQELAKRIVTELVCDVETQTVVFEQFHAGLGSFKGDLRRVSGHKAGFDHVIAGHFRDIVGVDGSLSTHNFGFSGHDIGGNTVLVGGVNWNDATSFASVNSAYLAARHSHQVSVGGFIH